MIISPVLAPDVLLTISLWSESKTVLDLLIYRLELDFDTTILLYIGAYKCDKQPRMGAEFIKDV